MAVLVVCMTRQEYGLACLTALYMDLLNILCEHEDISYDLRAQLQRCVPSNCCHCSFPPRQAFHHDSCIVPFSLSDAGIRTWQVWKLVGYPDQSNR